MSRTDGQRRWANIRALGMGDNGIKRPGGGDRTGELSLAAELLVARRYGVTDQISATANTTCDIVAETHYRAGRRWRTSNAHLEVKWTDRLDGSLIEYALDSDIARGGLPPHDTHICTAYMLVVGADEASLRIVGWTWGFELVKHFDTALPRPAWRMPQSAIRKNCDLLMAVTFGLAFSVS